MKKLHFENTSEFETLFKSKEQEITDAIVEGIQEAVNYAKKTAYLFEVTFEQVHLSYEISLPSSQWEKALDSCLKHYEELNESDKAIDTYLLKKQVREWVK